MASSGTRSALLVPVPSAWWDPGTGPPGPSDGPGQTHLRAMTGTVCVQCHSCSGWAAGKGSPGSWERHRWRLFWIHLLPFNDIVNDKLQVYPRCLNISGLQRVLKYDLECCQEKLLIWRFCMSACMCVRSRGERCVSVVLKWSRQIQNNSKYEILKNSSTALLVLYFPFLYTHEFFVPRKKFKKCFSKKLSQSVLLKSRSYWHIDKVLLWWKLQWF